MSSKSLQSNKLINEKNLLKLLDMSADLMSTIDSNGFFVDLNEIWESKTGYKLEELRDKPIIDFIHPEDKEKSQEEIEKLFTGQHCNVNFINRYLKKSGDILYLSWRSSFIAEENILICLATDVTKEEANRKNILSSINQVEDAKQELQLILDHLPNIIFYKDTSNVILRANKATADSMNLQPQDMANKHTREFYPEFAGKYYSDDLKVINSKKAKLGIEEKYINANNQERWIRTDKVPILDKSGEVQRLIAIATDITEQKINARELEEKNKSIELILKGAKLGFWELNNQTGKLTIDHIWLEKLGYQKGEVDEHIESVIKLIHPEDKTRILEKWDEHVAGLTDSYEAEFRMLHKNGQWIWILDKGMVISRDEYNLPLKSIGIHQNIHFIKEAEISLMKSNEELIRSNKELDDFAHIASHDLREPLRGIHYNSNFLLEDYKDIIDERGKERLERLIYLTERMNKLVDDLLFFSRLGKGELAKDEHDLNTIISEVAESLSTEEKISISIVNKLPVMLCDKIKIDTLFRNLVQNAIKYNDKDKIEIQIGSKKDEDNSDILYVKDNGIGIAEKHFEEIFKIFKRIHKRDAYGGGSGSGLSFVKKIIDLHNGKIWLESELGIGSSFYIKLWNR